MAKRRGQRLQAMPGEFVKRTTAFADSLKTLDEVSAAWDGLKVRYRQLQDRLARQVLTSLDVGDRVQWTSKRWPFTKTGVITDFGKRNVMVKADTDSGGLQWRISASLLTKAEAPARKRKAG